MTALRFFFLWAGNRFTGLFTLCLSLQACKSIILNSWSRDKHNVVALCRAKFIQDVSFFPPFFSFGFSKLVINQIIPEDDAIYQCMAENSQGSILSRARLTVVMSEDRPSAPYNVHAETMSSSAILLAWERPLYNSDKVIAYSVHYMKAEGKQFGLNTT